MAPQLDINAQIDGLSNRIAKLASVTPRLPPGSVKTAVARGRRELGFESAYLPLASANATSSPVLTIQVNNDADFVAVRPYLFQVGAAGAGIPIPPSVTVQIRDLTTGGVIFRQAGTSLGAFTGAYNPGSPYSSGRFVGSKRPWQAPHVIPKGAAVLVEISNPSGYTFVGDLFFVYEGYRVYAGTPDPIAATYSGNVMPFVWNGSVTIPGGLAAGVQALASIPMQGIDQSRYVLSEAAIFASNAPAAVGGVTLFPEDVLLIQIQDTYAENKLWGRVSNPVPAYGQFFPAKAFVNGGRGGPWVQPRYVGGTDLITVSFAGDPSAWAGGTPGTIEIQLKGIRIY